MLKFLVIILAIYRISLLITWDTIFDTPRNWIGTHSNDFIREYLGYLVNCSYCVGIWIALFLAIIYYPENWLLMTFAIAGGQVFLQKLENDI